MKINKLTWITITLMSIFSLNSCEKENDSKKEDEAGTSYVYILNEGQYGKDNASLSYYNVSTENFVNDHFSQENGSKLGDTANDIIITDKIMAIVVNGSDLIQYCDLNGKALGQTEIAGPRRMVADPSGKYLYVSSWAGNGKVVKISLKDYSIKAEVKVGHDPEGIVYYNGKLYVANSGGNAYLGEYNYEQSISIIDADSMTEQKRVDTGCYNLYGGFVQNDEDSRFILVNACGDYYMQPSCSFIFDCKSETVVEKFDFPATYAVSYHGDFFSMGSVFSYIDYSTTWYLKEMSINDNNISVKDGIVSDEVNNVVKSMSSPYGMYIAKDGCIYISDAGDYTNRGSVSIFNKQGQFVRKEIAGVCPGHFAER